MSETGVKFLSYRRFRSFPLEMGVDTPTTENSLSPRPGVRGEDNDGVHGQICLWL